MAERIRYTEEQKANALALLEEKSVKAVSEELNISVQTLSKWRRDAKGKTTSQSKEELLNSVEAMLAQETIAKDKQIEKLEAENKELRDTIGALEEKVNKFRKTIELLVK